MTTSRVTITLPEELRQVVADAAKRDELSFSAVVTNALSRWARGQLLDAWLREYQEEFGAFTEEELRAAAKEANVPYIPPTSLSSSEPDAA